MNPQQIREYCLKKKGVKETLPFGDDNPVYKVMNKMFLISTLDPPYTINVKCDPELAVELRERHDEVTPGYHMNKTHWNTVDIEGTLPPKMIYEMIDNSYDLIVQSLKKRDREEIRKVE